MACLDVDLCDKIDILIQAVNDNTQQVAYIGTEYSPTGTKESWFLQGQSLKDVSNLIIANNYSISGKLDYIEMFLFIGVIGAFLFIVIRWLFRLISSIALGW